MHNCKYSYLLWCFIVLLSKILLLIEFCFIIFLIFLIFSPCPKYTSIGVRLSNDSWNDFRHARKCQTFRETTFAERGNAKPFGKRLSPCAEMPNHSGNNFSQARKLQTIREITFAKRGNAKPFKKWVAGSPQATNPLKNNLQIKILLLHQKDKLKNKIKQDHFKWFHRPLCTITTGSA